MRRRPTLALLLSALLLHVPGVLPGTATPAAADVGTLAVTSLAPGLTLTDTTISGPNKINILTANLAEPTLKPKYLNPGTVGATATLSSMADRVGVVAAVNGDFFDIGVTGAPRGVGMDNGALIHAPASGWNNVAALYTNGTSTRGGVAGVFLDGKITLPGGTQLTATNLNSPNIAANGIGLYNASWGDEPRSQVVDGSTRTREIEISGGVVTKVSTTPGGKVSAGTVAVLGLDAGADALAGVAVGQAVTVNYTPRGGDGVQVAVGGNLVLVRDGVATTTEHPKNPRTAVGFSADGLKMWLVTVDGRSTASVGMTYVELANYMKSLGADDALNLDGGGSTTMVARMPGATAVSVRNTPSDGTQRLVPNGIGFLSTAQPWSAIIDNTTAGRFTASANWGTSTYSTQRYGADYRFATPNTTASDVAWYKANIPQTGSYEVSVWYAANSGYNDSTPYIVATTTGNQTVRVNQRANGGRWVSLGVFTLAAGDADRVGVSRWTSGTGYVIADAVRITRA
ncbi:MAG: hypothetical protein HOV79_35080 [Hamadaea sp.]|nr:hypothetical protein [Hamadaea sp.]